MQIKKLYSDSLAFAEKDLKLAFRYKVNFFAQTFLTPLTTVMPFLLVYSGYFLLGGTQVENLSDTTFVTFLLIGTIVNITLRLGFNRYLNKFKLEKYWQTLDAISITPISKLSLILGGMIDGLVSVIPGIIIISFAAYLFFPTSLAVVLPFVVLIIFALIISLCLGLIAGLASIFNENYSTIFQYSLLGIVFLSCFFYPISFFDNHPILALLKTIVLINPYYHIVTLMRGVWFGTGFSTQSFIFVSMFVVAMPFISVALFNWVWKRFTVEGY
ncbi:hypothetical protein CL622_02765 [archaeon]|nr:hypothetical protein [archaeon]